MTDQTRSPYAAYAAIMATFVGGVSAITVVAAHLRREPVEQRVLDLAVLSLATFKAARTLAQDDVTSFIREPFVAGAPTDADEEQPLPTGGPKQAIGELVTCSRCIGTWVAAGIVGMETLTPRFARTLTLSLAIAGVNDWFQAGFSALTAAANKVAQGG